MTEVEALEKACKIAGGQNALARLIGKKQAHIWHWLRKQKKASAESVLAIEKATKRQVSRCDLRPDLYPRRGKSS